MAKKNMSSFYAFPLHNEGPFVYYQSLLSKDPEVSFGVDSVIKGADKFLMGGSNMVSQNTRRGAENISRVMSTLLNMVNYESAKEQKAFEEIQRKILKMNITGLPSPKNNPYEFIVAINEILKGQESFKNELFAEKNRIEQSKNIFTGKTKKEIASLAKESSENAALLHNLANTLEGITSERTHSMTAFSGLGKKNSIASKISLAILQKYGERLLQYSNGTFAINGAQLNIIIGLITEEFRKKMIMGKAPRITQKTSLDEVKKILDGEKEIDEMVDNIMKNYQQFSSFSSSIIDGIIDDKKYNASLLQGKSAQRARNLAKELQSILPNSGKQRNTKFDPAILRLAQEITAATNSITPKVNIEAEILPGIDFSKLAGKATMSGGYAKDDIGAIMVTIDESAESLGSPEKIKQLSDRISNLRNEALKKIRYLEGTAKEYQNSSRIIKENLLEIESEYERMAYELSVNVETLKEIVGMINFSGNVKSYDTIESKTKAFSGGSVGHNLEEQLTNFANLLQIAGYGTTNYDSLWLKTAIINTGSGLLGQSLKGNLEDYFSSLMGLLLFDDAYYTIEQGTEFLKQNLSPSTADGIHLYYLNSTYVPASFILNETYKSLNNEINKASSMGIKVSIHARKAQNKTFNSPYDWISEREAALSEAKLSIDFMANFLTFLNNLANAFKV